MLPLRIIFICSLLASVGCSHATPEQSSESEPTKSAAPLASSTTASTPASAASVAPKPAPIVELEIGAVGSTMAFDKKSLTVHAGSQIHLVLKDAKPGTLMHNWVLVRPGTEAAVAAAGLPAGAAGNFVTPGPDVLAFTPMAPPGGSTEVTFQAPPAGTYPYICSFPGHYLVMKGTLTVTP